MGAARDEAGLAAASSSHTRPRPSSSRIPAPARPRPLPPSHLPRTSPARPRRRRRCPSDPTAVDLLLVSLAPVPPLLPSEPQQREDEEHNDDDGGEQQQAAAGRERRAAAEGGRGARRRRWQRVVYSAARAVLERLMRRPHPPRSRLLALARLLLPRDLIQTGPPGPSGFHGCTGQLGCDGRCCRRPRPPRDRVDGARRVPIRARLLHGAAPIVGAHGGEPAVPGGVACGRPRLLLQVLQRAELVQMRRLRRCLQHWMIRSLGYWNPRNSKVRGKSGTQGALMGVGLSIGYPLAPNGSTTRLSVMSAAPRGPAEKAGIVSGDVILAIDDASAQDIWVLRSSVDLTILSGADTRHFVLKRERYTLNPVMSRMCEIPGSEDSSEIGYIKLTTFNQNAAGSVKEAIKKLRENNVKPFVLDLRNNSGGLFPEGIEIAKIW
ncbi:hypothetical protein CFC21_042570 [Triticum aestivum]|uniref:PDZ domain-containing protein n=5 Tax=Triticum aestivum TaxID=4565 RepID=A0A3B6FR30_WHEAT|nr:hypothetical protein CFC21_042570 [Triticum aestivum]